jgi:hypothetical protein
MHAPTHATKQDVVGTRTRVCHAKRCQFIGSVRIYQFCCNRFAPVEGACGGSIFSPRALHASCVRDDRVDSTCQTHCKLPCVAIL